MAKVHVEYDTNTKEMSVKHDGETKDNVHGIHFEKTGETKDGKPTHEMRMSQYEKDKEHDTQTAHHTYAKKYEDQKVQEKVVNYLNELRTQLSQRKKA